MISKEEREKRKQTWIKEAMRHKHYFLLLRGYETFRDSDDWIGIYDDVDKLRERYRIEKEKLEEEHREERDRGWYSELSDDHEDIRVHIYDEENDLWVCNVETEG